MESHIQGSKYLTDQANRLVKNTDLHKERKGQDGTRTLTASRNTAVWDDCPPTPHPWKGSPFL